MAWWIRPEVDKTGKYAVATKYKNAGLAKVQQRKVSETSGEIKEEFSRRATEALPGDLVSFTMNQGTPGEWPGTSVKEDQAGEYKVYLLGSNGKYFLHTQAYETLTRANQIVKKYLRPYYKECVVMYCKREKM